MVTKPKIPADIMEATENCWLDLSIANPYPTIAGALMAEREATEKRMREATEWAIGKFYEELVAAGVEHEVLMVAIQKAQNKHTGVMKGLM